MQKTPDISFQCLESFKGSVSKGVNDLRKVCHTLIRFVARLMFAFAICQYAPARRPKAIVRVRKIMTKHMLVRTEQMR